MDDRLSNNRPLIGGHRPATTSLGTRDHINPATGKVQAVVPVCGPAEIDAAARARDARGEPRRGAARPRARGARAPAPRRRGRGREGPPSGAALQGQRGRDCNAAARAHRCGVSGGGGGVELQ